jgi:hypothetical protein
MRKCSLFVNINTYWHTYSVSGSRFPGVNEDREKYFVCIYFYGTQKADEGWWSARSVHRHFLWFGGGIYFGDSLGQKLSWWSGIKIVMNGFNREIYTFVQAQIYIQKNRRSRSNDGAGNSVLCFGNLLFSVQPKLRAM